MKYWIAAAMLTLVVYANACDVCGSGSSGYSFGSGVFFSKNLLGLQWKKELYRSTHPTLFNDEIPLVSNEQFNVVQLYSKIFIAPKWAFSCNIPYVINQRSEFDQLSTNHGLGDISLGMSKIQEFGNDTSKIWSFTQEYGCFIKSPTGKSAEIDGVLNIVIPNMQLGTGAFDFSPYVRTVAKSQKFTLVHDITYTYRLANKQEYKYGNALVTGIVGLYETKRFQSNDLKLFPKAGLQFRHFSKDKDLSLDEQNDYTGGYFLLANAGVEFVYNNFLIGAEYSLPVSYQYAGGSVEPFNQFNLSFNIKI